ncbi:bifunctional hydroxymethylpyrimidine kinase/phosphomethylpyrimidine kinase [Marinimicrobium agarilyticum]|uniref:bifunctional hydroxymethylpyrimidine kinase/phosphomethylpyrimidine kinase n=1 Tax=Marinimicrobium agarilyticum TaxID=306546 RepID=UPI0004180550|nr:bifunctional hydroxymethylpyrimidine kinase/phosphomethylpyrimidine kinase [Marinimicrobium agarilyticum]
MNDILAQPHRSGPPVALTIAGSDSGGGAGIQADLKTFAACGVFGCSALTALTAQNSLGVQSVHPVPPAFVTEQLNSVLSDFSVRAIKTGMLANVAVLEAVVDVLNDWPDIPLVVDPVMVATSGDRLLEPEAERVIRDRLLPRANLITPNLPEAAALLGEPRAEDQAGLWRQAEQLLAMGPEAVLLKGGHSEGPEAMDLLLSAELSEVLSRPRLKTANSHGSGCTLSAAIAAGLARGLSLATAVAEAKDFVQGALAGSIGWQLGAGAGPLDHFYRQHWPEPPIPSSSLLSSATE